MYFFICVIAIYEYTYTNKPLHLSINKKKIIIPNFRDNFSLNGKAGAWRGEFHVLPLASEVLMWHFVILYFCVPS